MKIGIDMDDTIENLVDAWCIWLNNKYGYSYTNSDIAQWHLEDTYKGLTKEQICEPLLIPEFWDTVKPKEDAIVYLKKLMDDGHDVYICTYTDYRIAKEKFDRVLFKYFPYLNKKQLFSCYDKWLCNFDVLVDDSMLNLVNGDYVRICYNTPHNQFTQDKEFNIHRFDNWEEIYNFIKEIE